VDVALIDSGVSPVAGAPTVVRGPDLTTDRSSSALPGLDAYGHGTHMAGIIAGHDPAVTDVAAASGNRTDFLGVAPDARVVSVKAGDAQGRVDVSQVIAGIDWVVQHAHDNGLNIRVLNLSYGTDSKQSYEVDPLSFAVEQAWKRGIVVVTSAGNSGDKQGRLTDPASDPFVIAVGADDTMGTVATGDDTVPSFSSLGNGVRNPDLVAPGVHVQSLRTPGSTVDLQFGATAGITDRFLRGSGTSQAAAMVSGAAALLLQKYPGATPDRIKGALVANATALPAADRQAQGGGLVSLLGAVQTTAGQDLVQRFTASTGRGSLEGSRGSRHLTSSGRTLSGERDVAGQAVDTGALAAAETSGSAWTGGSYNGRTWAGSTWAGSTWAGSTWAGSTWAGSTWAGSTWAGSTWAGSTWAGSTWAGSTWAGSTWADNAWL
jgi:serine protease AprX